MKAHRKARAAKRAPVLTGTRALTAALLGRVPFKLTRAQERVWREIAHDLKRATPMQRLLQGDVGSGKTIVAALAALQVIESGRQVALMAPTEILAEQHFRKLAHWLAELPVEIAWLTGGLPAKARRKALEAIASGHAMLAIGTHAPILIVDLAVPRDVEPEAANLNDVFLYTVDDLSTIVQGNLQIRQEAVAQAEAMIAAQAESFLRWLEGRSVVPTITALHGHHDQLRAAELERARRLLAHGTPPEQVLDALARGLTNKFLHGPTQALNQAGDAERAELVAMLERIYRLPDNGH